MQQIIHSKTTTISKPPWQSTSRTTTIWHSGLYNTCIDNIFDSILCLISSPYYPLVESFGRNRQKIHLPVELCLVCDNQRLKTSQMVSTVTQKMIRVTDWNWDYYLICTYYAAPYKQKIFWIELIELFCRNAPFLHPSFMVKISMLRARLTFLRDFLDLLALKWVNIQWKWLVNYCLI